MGATREGLRVAAARVLAGTALLAASIAAGGASAAAAGRGGGGGGGGGSSSPAGNDISFEQCGGTFPGGQAFGIVGVNGGLANDLDPCLGPSASYPSYTESELYWAAATSTGATSQPKASVYVNTADPGNVYNGALIADWPTSGSTPYGSCTTTTVTTSSGTATAGANSTACAWQYGYDRATQDAQWLSSAASAIDAQSPSVTVATAVPAYPWWLDVETANTWQSGTSGQAMNVADLQGMVAALQAAGATTVGVYSTTSQWDAITGGSLSTSGSLAGLPDWVTGARNESGAQANCAAASFTGGRVAVSQWLSHPYDSDVAC